MRIQLLTYPLFVSTLLSLFCGAVAADLKQAIIDDEAGDSLTQAKPNYIGGWGQGWRCDQCNLKPSTSEAYMGTWHDTTHLVGSAPSGVNFEFTGVSLEVFCILPPNNALAILNYSLTFEMDGKDVGTPFKKTKEDLTAEYQYNVSVVSLRDLPNTKHNFTMVLKSEDLDSVALFDYAVYQFESTGDSTNATTSGTSSSADPTHLSSVIPNTTVTHSSATSPAPGSATSSGAQAGTGNNGVASTLRLGHGKFLRGMLMMLIGLWVL